MRKPSSVLKPLALCVGIVLILSSFAQAQSGRRPPKRSESEGVQRPSEPEPPVKPSEQKQSDKEQIPVLVVESNSYFSSSYYSDYVAEACTARLKQAATLMVEKSAREMNRKEASDAAKPPTPRFVVLLELTSDRTGYDRRRDRGYYADDVVVTYTIFEQGTGKLKNSGRVYARRGATTAGGVGIPLPVPADGPAAAEYMLKQAGRETADRVLDALSVSPSPRN
ncbi:MAG TPA: hypothetical protein VKA70_03175 [Blastocatellia bacterium]|nr:hypothetical protein [Blastocatellia bacterium]